MSMLNEEDCTNYYVTDIIQVDIFSVKQNSFVVLSYILLY
jgi:hypothetical protein